MYIKNGLKCSKVLEMLAVTFSKSTLPQKSVYKWYRIPKSCWFWQIVDTIRAVAQNVDINRPYHAILSNVMSSEVPNIEQKQPRSGVIE